MILWTIFISWITIHFFFLWKWVLWLRPRKTFRKRIHLSILNFWFFVIYSWFCFAQADSYVGYSDIGVPDLGGFAYLMLWFFVELVHLCFFGAIILFQSTDPIAIYEEEMEK